MMPAILLIAAIGLFVGFTNGAYQDAKALAAERDAYDSTLNTSKERRAQRDALLAKESTFTQDDITKLTRLLPDNVDNIRLIIDINNIAARHNLSLKNVQLGNVSGGKSAGSNTAVGASGDPVGSVTLGFSVNSSYDNFQAFLLDLEHSLRIIDIQKLDFKNINANPDQTDFNITIRTYWLH